MMWIVILIVSIYVFLKTIGYGYYEYKKNNNKISGTIIMILSFISLIIPAIVTVIRCYS